MAGARAGDWSTGPLPYNPRQRCDHAVEEGGVLLRTLLVASVGCHRSPLSFDCCRNDRSYLLGRADDVAEAADQFAAVLASYCQAVVLADQPAQQARSAVRAVLAIAAQPTLVGFRD